MYKILFLNVLNTLFQYITLYILPIIILYIKVLNTLINSIL